MQRVTTPVHEFIIDIDPHEWDEFRITYTQNRRIILEKTQNDPIAMDAYGEKYRLYYRLTQEETKRFGNMQTHVQIRAHYPDGATVASEICMFQVEDVLSHEILGRRING